MAILFITLQIKSPERDYRPVKKYLSGFSHCRQGDSLWFVEISMAPEVLREELRTMMAPDDTALIVRMNREWSSFNLPCARWLNEIDRSW